MTGYDKLAKLFKQHDDLAMFRSFTALNAKNLLYMQAELLHLEKDLENQNEFDSESGDPAAKSFALYWKALDDAAGDETGVLQKKMVLKIREKLNEYCEDSDLRLTKLWSLIVCRKMQHCFKQLGSRIWSDRKNATSVTLPRG